MTIVRLGGVRAVISTLAMHSSAHTPRRNCSSVPHSGVMLASVVVWALPSRRAPLPIELHHLGPVRSINTLCVRHLWFSWGGRYYQGRKFPLCAMQIARGVRLAPPRIGGGGGKRSLRRIAADGRAPRLGRTAAARALHRAAASTTEVPTGDRFEAGRRVHARNGEDPPSFRTHPRERGRDEPYCMIRRALALNDFNAAVRTSCSMRVSRPRSSPARRRSAPRREARPQQTS